MKQYAHPTKEEMKLTVLLHALSDPVRLSVVQSLASSACAKVCSSFEVPVHKSTMSHHMRVLREAGLIYIRSEKTFGYITLRHEELEERFPGLLCSVLSSAQKEAIPLIEPKEAELKEA
jgi:DNA-binding transcriptional ArsR family regulator